MDEDKAQVRLGSIVFSTYIKLLYLSVVFYEPWILSPSYMKAKSSLASYNGSISNINFLRKL